MLNEKSRTFMELYAEDVKEILADYAKVGKEVSNVQVIREMSQQGGIKLTEAEAEAVNNSIN